MARLTLSVFGPPQLVMDGMPVKVQRRKVMALLIYLSVCRRNHARDELAAMFWPEEGQARARAALRRTVSELNRIAGLKVVKTGIDALSLADGLDFDTDAGIFFRYLDDVRNHVHASGLYCADCLSNLSAAVKLYEGDFCSGFVLRECPDFDSWISQEAEAQRLAYIRALKQQVIILQASDQIYEAIEYTRRWLKVDPTDESAHRLMMEMFAASGRKDAAIHQYQECAQILARDLGIRPMNETTELYQRLCAKTAAPVHKAGRQVGRSGPIHNLPATVNVFIGRRAELDAVVHRLRQPEVRLLTLTGPGGVGKTRLSLQIAQNMLDDFWDGVFFVPLAPLEDANLVASAIAHSLGVRESGRKPVGDRIKEKIRPKKMLLVLDNYEHVLAAAGLMGELLEAAPGLKILATSRAPLEVYGEHLYPVEPLARPQAASFALLEYESVQLFVERASEAQVGFSLDQANVQTVAEICRRLDGLPLAIELAASQVGWLLPETMLAQFKGPDGFFPFYLFANGPRDKPARHQTLHSAIAWSYDLLPPGEQAYFRRLAVFAGGAELPAVQAVCEVAGENGAERDTPGAASQSRERVAALVKKGLLVWPRANQGLRVHMLDSIRAYALEQLKLSGEEALARSRHAEYFLSLVSVTENRGERLTGREIVHHLERERDNLRSVLAWSVADWPENSLVTRLTAVSECLGSFMLPLGEQRQWMEKALTALERSPAGWSDDARSLSLDLQRRVGNAAYFQGDYPAARRMVEPCLSQLRAMNDRSRLANCLIVSSWTLLALGDPSQAAAYAGEALELGRETNQVQVVAHALNHLAWQAWSKGEYDRSEQMSAESLRLFQTIGNRYWEGILYLNLGSTMLSQGRLEVARELFGRGLMICWELTRGWGIGQCLEMVAWLEVKLGRWSEAGCFFAAAEKAFEAADSRLEQHERPFHEAYLAAARSGLGQAGFAAAWAEGAEFSIEQAVSAALRELLAVPQPAEKRQLV